MLDLESFTYLTRALESTIAPIVILASNRGMSPIRGSDSSLPWSAHGIPPDLLARLLIVPTHKYQLDEVKAIIRSRAKVEGVTIEEPALDRVADLGNKVSLRYAIQLLAPASVLAKVGGKAAAGVSVKEIEECEDLFLDQKRSARAVGADASGYIA